jgi:hypothetical protein
MGPLQCSCGYAGDEGEFADHLAEAFVPLYDDTGTDGQAHAELAANRARTSVGSLDTGYAPELACLCGFAAGDGAELDDHLLAAFITADRVGADGDKHEPACLAAPSAG